MELELHNAFIRSEIIEQLFSSQQTVIFREGEFICSSQLTACFFKPASTVLRCPTLIEWRPADKSLPLPWSSVVINSVQNAYHIFVEFGDGWLNIGQAHLGSWSHDGSSASFYLRSRIPRDKWVELGGYPGWLLEINHQPQRIAANDYFAADESIFPLRVKKYGHASATRYEEDSLQLFLNSDRGWLMYLREFGDTGLYVKAVGDELSDELFRCTCGTSLSFTHNQTLDREVAIREFRDFLATGQLSKRYEWEER